MASYATVWGLRAGWPSLTLAGGLRAPDPPKYALVTPQYGDCVQGPSYAPGWPSYTGWSSYATLMGIRCAPL